MKKHTLFIAIVLIAVIIIAAFLYVVLRPKEEALVINSEGTGSNSQDSGTRPSDGLSPDTSVPSETVEGKYIEYTEANFTANSSKRRVIFFHAPWCPQCRALEKSIQEGTIPAGMVILKTDYDTSNGLKQTYGVTLQTTLVEVDENGKLKKKFVAYDEPSLQAVINALGQ